MQLMAITDLFIIRHRLWRVVTRAETGGLCFSLLDGQRGRQRFCLSSSRLACRSISEAICML
jgi:hypothetical protein